MTATTDTMDTRPRGRRLGALIDLGLWLAAIVALQLGGWLAFPKLSLMWRFLIGEPVGMVFLLGTVTLILRRRRETWRDVGLARPAAWGRTLGRAAIGYLVVIAANAALTFLVLRPLHVPEANVKVVLPALANPAAVAGMVALSWTTVGFGEEMLFRGFLFTRLENLFGRGRAGTLGAWLAQGALFGLPHIYQGVGGTISTGLIGLVLGGLYLRSGRNLAASIVLHGTIDTVSLVGLYVLNAYRLI
jgi:hypothetical protein